jgi:hypothetical protein
VISASTVSDWSIATAVCVALRESIPMVVTMTDLLTRGSHVVATLGTPDHNELPPAFASFEIPMAGLQFVPKTLRTRMPGTSIAKPVETPDATKPPAQHHPHHQSGTYAARVE